MRAQSALHRLTFTRLLTLFLLVLMGPALACAIGSGSTKARQSRKYVVLLCKASDIPTLPHDQAYYQKLFTDKTPGLKNVYNYFLDESYGAIDINGTVVKGWLTTLEGFAQLSTLKRHDLAQRCADAFKYSVHFPDFASGGIITIWNLEGADGGASAIGLGAKSDSIVEDGLSYPLVNAGAGAKLGENAVSFFTHEMLHTMGLDHARGPYPGQSPSSLASTYIDAGNTHTFGANAFDEYGDCWTIMGCGVMTTDYWGPLGEYGPDLGAYQRDYLGWMPSGRVLLWDNGRTTKVTLAPANRSDVAGTLLVKIPIDPSLRPGPCCSMYTVEYIEKAGWSAGIGMDHAVLIHEIRPDDPAHTYLVSRTLFGAWLPGQVFLDSASHVRISIDSYGPTAGITLSATGPSDDGHLLCTPEVVFPAQYVIKPDVPPVITVQAPLPNAHVIAGTPLTLQATALDPTHVTHPPVADAVPESQMSWSANGISLGTGSSLVHTFASPGDYTVQVTALTSFCGLAQQSVILHVDPPSLTPTVSILQPVEGQEYLVGAPSFSTTITFVGTGSSTVTTFDWSDSTIGWFGEGDHVTENIPLSSTSRNCVVEPHKITLRGKTATGEVAEASITITLKTNCIR